MLNLTVKKVGPVFHMSLLMSFFSSIKFLLYFIKASVETLKETSPSSQIIWDVLV